MEVRRILLNVRRPGTPMSRGVIAAAAGALALLIGLLIALRPAPVQVDLAAVSRGPLRVTVDEEGKTRVKDVFVVSAPVSGKLRRSALDPGDRVVKDKTVIAVIEPAAPIFLDVRTRKEAEAQVAAAEAAVTLATAEVRQAESDVAWATSELQRAEALARSSTVPERTLERARLELDKQRASLARANANLEVRRSELATAKARLIGPERIAGVPSDPSECCVEVRAPQSGQVLRELQESERVVLAGSPLFEIGNAADLDVVVDLLSSDAVRVSPGAEATIESTGLEAPIRARVRLIEPAGFTKVSALGIEEQRVRVFLDLETPAEVWKRLGHDYRVFARITAWSSLDSLRVPLSALFRRGDGWAVYCMVSGRAALTLVDVGHRNSDFAEVLSGLKPQDVVVLHPSDRIVSGTRISRRASEAP
jgi:HlyD family secretion protein